jgi:hypothetical protein
MPGKSGMPSTQLPCSASVGLTFDGGEFHFSHLERLIQVKALMTPALNIGGP